MQHVTSFHINSVNISNNMSDLLWIVHVSRSIFSSSFLRKRWTGHTHTVINWMAKQSQNWPHSSSNRSSHSHCHCHSHWVLCLLYLCLFGIECLFSLFVPLSINNCLLWMTLCFVGSARKSTRKNSHKTVLIILQFTNWHGFAVWQVCVYMSVCLSVTM